MKHDTRIMQAADEVKQRLDAQYPPGSKVLSATTVALVGYRVAGQQRTGIVIGIDDADIPIPLGRLSGEERELLGQQAIEPGLSAVATGGF